MHFPLVLSEDRTIRLHERLIAAVTEAIDGGRLSPGSSMPSSRILASSLGIARATVSKAYEELHRSGHLVSKPGGKTFVGARSSQAGATSVRLSVAPGSDPKLSQYARRLKQATIRREASAHMAAINYGAPPPWVLPVAAWRQTFTKYCNNLDPDQIEHNPHPFGYLPLREAVADYLARRKAVSCTEHQVMILAESQSALSYAARLLLDEGDVVIVENPGFYGARNIFNAYGAEVIPVPIDDQGLSIEALRQQLHRKIKLIYVTPSFHDPTGVCMSLSRRQELLQIAREHDILIVEDAWDSDHVFISPHLPCLQGLSLEQNVFYIYSFWKSLYPLCLVGCLVVPDKYAAIFAQEKQITATINPILEHYTLAEFIKEGLLEKQLKTISRQLTRMRQSLIRKLINVFGQAVLIKKQSSAFWLTVQIDQTIFKGDIRQVAQDADLAMISTEPYYVGKLTAPHKEFLVPFFNMSYPKSAG